MVRRLVVLAYLRPLTMVMFLIMLVLSFTALPPVVSTARAAVGDDFIPFWIQTYLPTNLWSGTDPSAVDFGPVPQFSYFRVVVPQSGPRLFVYNPLTMNYAYLDASVAGPSGPFVRPLSLQRKTGGEVVLQTELAATPEALEYGLMGRPSLPADFGMLFVMPQGTNYSFWMQDTFTPLSIAFISSDGTILSMQDMQPLTRELHHPGQPYAYALEVNQGWLRRNGIDPHDLVVLPDWVPRPTQQSATTTAPHEF